MDVFFTSVDYCSPVRLFRNRGDGTFEDRTEAAGLMQPARGNQRDQTDYNNDGRLDIFIMRGGWEVAHAATRCCATMPTARSPT